MTSREGSLSPNTFVDLNFACYHSSVCRKTLNLGAEISNRTGISAGYNSINFMHNKSYLLLKVWFVLEVWVSAQGLQPASHSQGREDNQHPTECETGGQGCWFWLIKGFGSWHLHSCVHKHTCWHTRIRRSRVRPCLHDHAIMLLLSISNSEVWGLEMEQTLIEIIFLPDTNTNLNIIAYK